MHLYLPIVISNDLTRPISLVKLAHALIKEKVKSGDIVIDATVGNGYDTGFLYALVEPNGNVYGFDIQEAAIDKAKNIENYEQALSCLTLICASHADMADYIPLEHWGRISAVMFNLGYLPGSDKQIKTQSESTLLALASASRLLKPGGLITILAYPGHAGGDVETYTVDQWRLSLDAMLYQTALYENHPENPHAPKLFTVTKIG